MSIRILLADDHQIFREGLRALLEKTQDFEVVAEAEDGLEALRLVNQFEPQLVVMDVTMRGLNGIEATRQITETRPNTKVLGLSMHVESRFAMEMLAAGASGYLPKHCAAEELVTAIRTVMTDESYLSPSMTAGMAQDYITRKNHSTETVFSKLTPREREVLQLLAEGASTQEVSKRLHISTKTTHTHREHIMAKLGSHSLAELTKYAIREGLTSAEE